MSRVFAPMVLIGGLALPLAGEGAPPLAQDLRQGEAAAHSAPAPAKGGDHGAYQDKAPRVGDQMADGPPAQHGSGPHGSGHDQEGGHAEAGFAAADTASTEAFRAANARMHAGMELTYTGDADVDFMRGMVAHHQGAVDMAQIVLQHGLDPEVKKLAANIVATQEAEIAQINAWLVQHGF